MMQILTLRVRNVLFGGECRKCDCNGHSASCNSFTFKCGVRAIHFLTKRLDFAQTSELSLNNRHTYHYKLPQIFNLHSCTLALALNETSHGGHWTRKTSCSLPVTIIFKIWVLVKSKAPKRYFYLKFYETFVLFNHFFMPFRIGISGSGR